MKVEVKAYKKFHGHDGRGFDCSLYIDGKRTAIISDDGWGGEWMIDIFDQARFDAMEMKIKALPPLESEYGPMDMDVDIWVEEYLLGTAEASKSRKIMTRAPDGKEYVWDAPYKKANREKILEQLARSKNAEGHILLNGMKATVELA